MQTTQCHVIVLDTKCTRSARQQSTCVEIERREGRKTELLLEVGVMVDIRFFRCVYMCIRMIYDNIYQVPGMILPETLTPTSINQLCWVGLALFVSYNSSVC